MGISPSKITEEDINSFNILLATSKNAISRKRLKEDPPSVYERQEIVNVYNMSETLDLFIKTTY